MNHNSAPKQHEIESFLDDVLKRADRASIAAWLDLSPSQISQECDPEISEKKSKYYQCARFIWAAYKTRRDLGDLLMAKLNCLSAIWRGDVSADRDVAALAGRATGEAADVAIAELNKRPYRCRLNEALQARAAIDSYIAGLRLEGIEDSPDADSQFKSQVIQ